MVDTKAKQACENKISKLVEDAQSQIEKQDYLQEGKNFLYELTSRLVKRDA